jgi:flavodoxin
MKALVVYSSKTGNTRKLAQTVYDDLSCEKEIHAMESAPDPRGFDLVALGFWLQGGKPDLRSAEFMGKLGTSDVFLFATHGAAAGSDHAKKAMDYAKSLVVSARIRGTFSCPGEVDPAHLEKARAKDPQPVWIKDAPAAVGRPNEEDLRSLKAALKEAVGPAAA